ncbi:MAG: hypothetical protein SFY56_06455 [Bacteroidota bacterium]|nr:hypothetical protein [Bacteroidota bacterium]
MKNKPNSGDEPEKEILNIEILEECPTCLAPTVTLFERVLISGSLQNYHIITTEVDEIFECKNCKNKWSRMVFL